jgi:hypothetical protein
VEVWPPWLQIQNLPALQASCNGKLQIKLEAVSAALEDGYEVVFELVTTGTLTADAKNDLAAFQSTIAEFERPEASLTPGERKVGCGPPWIGNLCQLPGPDLRCSRTFIYGDSRPLWQSCFDDALERLRRVVPANEIWPPRRRDAAAPVGEPIGNVSRLS